VCELKLYVRPPGDYTNIINLRISSVGGKGPVRTGIQSAARQTFESKTKKTNK
jgi:hypothetical protein